VHIQDVFLTVAAMMIVRANFLGCDPPRMILNRQFRNTNQSAAEIVGRSLFGKSEGLAMKVSAVAALLILASTPAFAATVTPKEAANHIGENVTVEGVAYTHVARSGSAAFLDLGGRYPNHDFAAVIFRSRMGAFGDISRYEGKVVDVTGRVQEYDGKPEIVLIDTSQLRLK
jgi:DNA/RNA endonuclease YhcR with UshA esterase domain